MILIHNRNGFVISVRDIMGIVLLFHHFRYIEHLFVQANVKPDPEAELHL